MIFGEIARKKLQSLAVLAAVVTMALGAQPALAQLNENLSEVETNPAAQEADAAPGEQTSLTAEETVTEAAPFDYFGPDRIMGQPVDASEDMLASMQFQPQHTETGEYALWMHDYILIPMVFAISIIVLFLLLWVIGKYRRSANPVPSRTSHNTLIEVIWTVVPVIILVIIAVPSISLLAQQYESPPEDAITIKANGYQWYWGYEYVDNGGFEVISNMLSEE